MLILYGTQGCHLCDDAEQLLIEARGRRGRLTWELVDIAIDDDLFRRYGWHIPVLRCSTSEQELKWPFDAKSLDAFLLTA